MDNYIELLKRGFGSVIKEVQSTQGRISTLTDEQKKTNLLLSEHLLSIDEQMKKQTEALEEISGCLAKLCGSGAVIQSEVSRIENGLKTGKYEI